MPDPRVIKDIAYIADGDVRHRLNVILPADAAEPIPTVVRIHGGAWWAYCKDDVHIAHHLVDSGFALVTINYRYSRQAPFPAQLEDCKAAVRWMRANAARYGLATDALGVCGDSAGGHLACMLGLTGQERQFDVGGNLEFSSAVQAVMAWYPPTDLLNWRKHFGQCGISDEQANSVLQCMLPLLGGSVEQRPGEALLASPLTHVHAGVPPFLLVHGKADNVVPYPQSLELADAIRRAGGRADVHLVEGAGHGGPLFDTVEQSQLIAGFFRRHLAAVTAGAAQTN